MIDRTHPSYRYSTFRCPPLRRATFPFFTFWLLINSSVMLAGIQFCHTGLLPHGRSTEPSTLLDTALPLPLPSDWLVCTSRTYQKTQKHWGFLHSRKSGSKYFLFPSSLLSLSHRGTSSSKTIILLHFPPPLQSQSPTPRRSTEPPPLFFMPNSSPSIGLPGRLSSPLT